jgi:hypothetical protein
VISEPVLKDLEGAKKTHKIAGTCPVKCVNRLCVVPCFLPRYQLRLLR